MSKNYKIVSKPAYNGVFPITTWYVQVRKDGFFSDKWINVKGFELKEKAIALYELLSGEKYYG